MAKRVVAPEQTELEFLQDIYALLCETREQGSDPWLCIKNAMAEIGDRVMHLEEGDDVATS